MNFSVFKDPETNTTVYRLTITSDDQVTAARLTDLDHRLFKECSKSELVSDKILALETLVRRIEEGKNYGKEHD